MSPLLEKLMQTPGLSAGETELFRDIILQLCRGNSGSPASVIVGRTGGQNVYFGAAEDTDESRWEALTAALENAESTPDDPTVIYLTRGRFRVPAGESLAAYVPTAKTKVHFADTTSAVQILYTVPEDAKADGDRKIYIGTERYLANFGFIEEEAPGYTGTQIVSDIMDAARNTGANTGDLDQMNVGVRRVTLIYPYGRFRLSRTFFVTSYNRIIPENRSRDTNFQAVTNFDDGTERFMIQVSFFKRPTDFVILPNFSEYIELDMYLDGNCTSLAANTKTSGALVGGAQGCVYNIRGNNFGHRGEVVFGYCGLISFPLTQIFMTEFQTGPGFEVTDGCYGLQIGSLQCIFANQDKDKMYKGQKLAGSYFGLNVNAINIDIMTGEQQSAIAVFKQCYGVTIGAATLDTNAVGQGEDAFIFEDCSGINVKVYGRYFENLVKVIHAGAVTQLVPGETDGGVIFTDFHSLTDYKYTKKLQIARLDGTDPLIGHWELTGGVSEDDEDLWLGMRGNDGTFNEYACLTFNKTPGQAPPGTEWTFFKEMAGAKGVSNTGWINAGYAGGSGGFRVQGLQVVGARQVGWTAMTGTATKGGFDTSTITLPQLAQVVKALIDSGITHGAIAP